MSKIYLLTTSWAKRLCMIEEYNNQIYCFFIKRLPVFEFGLKNKNGVKTCFTAKASVLPAENTET
jgi:hypothetical protein